MTQLGFRIYIRATLILFYNVHIRLKGQFVFSILSCNSIIFGSLFYSILLYSVLFYLASCKHFCIGEIPVFYSIMHLYSILFSILFCILFCILFYSILSCIFQTLLFIGKFLFSILSCNSILFCSLFYSILYSILVCIVSCKYFANFFYVI